MSTALRFELGKDSVRLLSVLGMVKYLRRQGERAGTVIDRESCKGLTLARKYCRKVKIIISWQQSYLRHKLYSRE